MNDHLELTWTDAVAFFVPGKPAPGGSKRVIPLMRHGRPICKASGAPIFNVQDDCERNTDWRNLVAFYARKAMAGRGLLRQPVRAKVTFFVPRPKGHFGSGRNINVLKASAPLVPTVKPDTTKLWRAAEDALTKIVWEDDAQVVDQDVRRRYGLTPGAEITIQVLRDGGVTTGAASSNFLPGMG